MHDTIIALVKKSNARYLKCKQKFGIECLKIVDDALELNKKNKEQQHYVG